jgi:hypothetical protein
MDERLCFACEGTAPPVQGESAHHWVVPRQACAQHAGSALFEGGEALAGVVDGPWPDDFEGAGANLLLNPVRLGSRRAWLDVTTRGRAVVEEVFPAADYFEFAALHLAPFVDVLYEVRDLAPFAHREPLGMMAALGVDNTRYTAVQALLGLWCRARALQALLSAARLPRPVTLAEASRVWAGARAHLGQADPQPDDLRLFLVALLRLAGRRFAHLGGPAPA